MLGVDVLDAFKALEAISGTREERCRLKKIGEATGNRRCLQRMVICQELWDNIDSMTRNVAGSGEQVE